MKHRRIPLPALAALLALAAPVRATDTRDYARDEYVTIHGGVAPDRRLSLAAHGDGDGGSDNFHVWLMTEPAHRRIAALDRIGSSNNLDTGADSYRAEWSPDSRHVAVSFRSNRHVLQLNLYAIANRRAHLVTGPSLFKDITSREVGVDDDLRYSVSEITWKGTTRFQLGERRIFMTSDAGFRHMLGRYGRAMEGAGDGRLVVEFSAEADCVLLSGRRYRIVDNRVGKFGDSKSH